jgi:hypothetical protein
MIIVEKLLFDPNLHHPQVVISEAGLKADHPGSCLQYVYAKVNNVSWQNGRHYWEVTLNAPNRNVSFIHKLSIKERFGNFLRLLCIDGCCHIFMGFKKTFR